MVTMGMKKRWPNREDQLRRLLPAIAEFKPVLDLGCGDGLLLDLLARGGVQAEGVERDARCVRDLRIRGFTVHQGDVLEFLKKRRAGHFGAVVASHILEHLPPPRVPEFLAGCAKVLSDGGRLLILTPNPRNIGVITQTFWGDLEHQRPYALDLLVRLVGQAGLKVVEAGEDPYTRQPGLLHRPLNFVRRIIVGNYWVGADLLLLADKSGR